MTKRQTFIDRMRYWCDTASLGYDQGNRWDIREGGECDCSSLVYWCLWEAGYGTKPANPYSQTLYTGTLARDLMAMGFSKVANDGKPQPGDVLLNDVNHVAVCTGPGLLSQASIDENGRATGGASGDQTGEETNTRSYYDYPWNAYYRPPAETGASTTTTTKKGNDVIPIYNNGGDFYRYYNSSNGQHFITTQTEGKTLKAPWKAEGKAWTAKAGGTIPIYRMYEPKSGHHILARYDEAAKLEASGWKAESVPFFGVKSGTPVYRAYNPNGGDHLYTTSKAEYDSVVKAGWKGEGPLLYV